MATEHRDTAMDDDMVTKQKDIRNMATDGDMATGDCMLTKQWPSVPGRDTFGQRAALDCAVILTRFIWSRSKRKPDPKETDSPFTRYVWADFDNRNSNKETKERIDILAAGAMAHLQTNTSVPFFGQIMKGPDMVEALWSDPSFYLTWPVFKNGPSLSEAEVTCTGDALATVTRLKWDGLCSLTKVIDECTSEIADAQDPSLKTYRYFKAPSVLQVCFYPEAGSRQTLRTLWRVETDKYAPKQVNVVKDLWECLKNGTQCYTLAAVVLFCVDTKKKTSCSMIRLFCGSGTELLPWSAENNPMPEWPFKVDDVIPAGTMLTLFYHAVPAELELDILEQSQVDVNKWARFADEMNFFAGLP